MHCSFDIMKYSRKRESPVEQYMSEINERPIKHLMEDYGDSICKTTNENMWSVITSDTTISLNLILKIDSKSFSPIVDLNLIVRHNAHEFIEEYYLVKMLNNFMN